MVGLFDSDAPHRRARGNLAAAPLGAARHGLDGEPRARRAADWSAQATWVERKIGDVPHGVEQLTQLASVCVAGPDIIILDEPATGLSAREVDHLARNPRPI